MNKEVRSQITEGTTSILVYQQRTTPKGPGIKQGLPFYNPAMQLNRDLSICVVQWLLNSRNRPLHLLDGLSASGIRGVRFLHELTGNFEVTINDWSSDAYDLIKKNIEFISSSKGHATNENIHTLLSTQHFDYVDIDPFGSPAGYIDSAIRGCKHLGIIACTATDTAALCGTYPNVCHRRYASTPLHGIVMHEIGLRILLGFLGREAAKHDKGIIPILCYTTDHYMRIYVQLHNNINVANITMNDIRTIPSIEIYPHMGEKKRHIGPLWMGQLHNAQALRSIRSILFSKTLGTKNVLIKLLDLLEDESEAPPFFYTTDSIGSQVHCSPPPLNSLMQMIKDKGYDVHRTHFHPCGFKTTASSHFIEQTYREMQLATQ